MYTGTVEATGTVRELHRRADGATIEIACDAFDLQCDQSVAVAGVCLTVTDCGPGWFRADCSPETVDRTYLADLEPGTPVNLERPLSLADSLDGHLVRGTVDTVTEVLSVRSDSDDCVYTVATPPDYAAHVVEKGAVALDGVSLTVAATRPESFDVAVVPHTRELTTLSDTAPGDRVHFESDVLAKYVRAGAGGDVSLTH